MIANLTPKFRELHETGLDSYTQLFRCIGCIPTCIQQHVSPIHW